MDPHTEFVVYRSPDWRDEEGEAAPLYAHEWTDLLAHCRAARDRRRAAYPGMIAKGQITADLAARDIEAWELLVQEWHWIITGKGEPPHPLSLRHRQAAVDLAQERVRQEIERGNRTHDVLRQSHIVMALRWHLSRLRHHAPAVHHFAAINHELRAREAAGRKEAA